MTIGIGFDRSRSSRMARWAALLLGSACLVSGSYGIALAQETEETEEAGRASAGATVLDALVVTAAGFEQNVADAPASISVITREDLERGSFKDLTDALKEVQGVAVTGVANEKDIYIRGLPGAYTLILVDGKRQSTREARPNGNSGIEQSFIPPVAAIDRIEVVRGPMSALYGSDAMGGVINIITRKVDSVWSGSVTTEATLQQHTQYGKSAQASFYVSGPVVDEVVGIQMWGRGLVREEDSVVDGKQANRDRDINAKLTITPNEDHDIYIEGGFTQLRHLSSAGNTLAPTANDSYRDFDRSRWSVSHTGRWGPTTSEISFQQEFGSRETWTRDPVTGGYTVNERIPRIRNSVFDAKFTTPFDLFGQHTLVTGGQYNNASLTDRGHLPADQNMSVDQWALFVEDEWRLTDTFALTGGLRYDHHETYGGHFSPRIYGVWHAMDDLTIKGGVSTGFRAPDIRQLAQGYYLPTQQGAGRISPNPNLQPETSLNYELGALWEGPSGVTFGVTGFYTDFKQKISNMNTGQLVNPSTGSIIDPLAGGSCNNAALAPYPGYYCLWQYFNIDDAVIRGVELTASWEATADLTLRGSYTFTDSEQRTGQYAGFPLARTPRHQASLRADWLTPLEGLEVWGLATYHGSEIAAGARIGSNGSPVTINGQTGRKYDPYMLFDIGASYRFNDNFTVNGAVYNLFDKRIGETEFNTVGEGRRFWVSMTTEF